MEELFNGQLSFADIEADKFLQIRRTHADRRVNAMDRLTDDVINELIQLCLPLYHIKANGSVRISVSGEVIPGAAQRGCPLYLRCSMPDLMR